MTNSELLARLIGPYIIVIGIGLKSNQNVYRTIMVDFEKNQALIFITGIMTFIMGLAIVLFHNIWALDWRILITLFGWAGLIKGAWLIILPNSLTKITKRYTENFKLVLIPWTIMLFVGIFLTLKGYF